MWLNSHGVSSGSLRLLLAFLISFSVGCSGSNFFETFSNKEDANSLIRSVKDSLASEDYATAVSVCEAMESDDAATDEALYLCASAYAGSCGYDLFGVVDDVTNYSGSPLIFEYFMEQNNGATLAKIDSCNTALAKIRTIGAAADRTGDQNFLALFSGFTNIGVVLNTLADTDDDGTPDATFDGCDLTDFSDAQASQVGRALWELYRSSEVITTSITEISDLKTALDNLSTAISAVNVSYNFLLSSVNPDSFTANQIRGIRALVREGQAFGLNYACNNFAACICP